MRHVTSSKSYPQCPILLCSEKTSIIHLLFVEFRTHRFSSHFILINRTILYPRSSRPPPLLWPKPLPTPHLNSTFDHKKLTSSSTGLFNVRLQAYHMLTSEQQDGSGLSTRAGVETITANLKSWKISPAVYILTAFSLLNTWSYQIVAAARKIAGRLPPKTVPEPTRKEACWIEAVADKLEKRARNVAYRVLQLQIGWVRTNEVNMYVNPHSANFSQVESTSAMEYWKWAGRMLDPWNSMEQLTPSMDPEHPRIGRIRHTSPPIHGVPQHKRNQTACSYIFIDKSSIHGTSTANHGSSSATIRVPHMGHRGIIF